MIYILYQETVPKKVKQIIFFYLKNYLYDTVTSVSDADQDPQAFRRFYLDPYPKWKKSVFFRNNILVLQLQNQI